MFGAVRYRSLYPGIDMIYAGEGARLKSEFVVAPGADPSRIQIHYGGAGTPAMQPDGSLSIAVGEQRLSEAAPYIYQERNGAKTPVEGRYTIGTDGSVGFSLGDYDRAKPLIIDPLMAYSNLVGATNFNAATAIAVDSAGSAYIAGYTDSEALPTANPAQNYNAGSVSVFVAKLNPSGSALEYCTYMGGSDDDRAYGIAVDGTGAAEALEPAAPNSPTASAVVAITRLARRCLTLCSPCSCRLPGRTVPLHAERQKATRLTPMSVLVPVTIVLRRRLRLGRSRHPWGVPNRRRR